MRNKRTDFIWLLVVACLLMSALLAFYQPGLGHTRFVIVGVIVAFLIALVGLYIFMFVHSQKFREQEIQGVYNITTAGFSERTKQYLQHGDKWLYIRIVVALIFLILTIPLFDYYHNAYWIFGIDAALILISVMPINSHSHPMEQPPVQDDYHDRDI